VDRRALRQFSRHPLYRRQVVAAIAAAAVLWVIASSHAGWVPGGFASNGYGDLSPGKYGLSGCFVMEVVTTFFFLFIRLLAALSSGGCRVGGSDRPGVGAATWKRMAGHETD
jgi:aquaporin Z